MLGITGPYTLLWLTFALGLGSAMNGPAWQAIMPELVPKRELPSAIALNSIGFNLARAAGPALGGLVVAAIGAGAAFVLNAISFVGVLIVLYWWKREPEHETIGSEGRRPRDLGRHPLRPFRAIHAFGPVAVRTVRDFRERHLGHSAGGGESRASQRKRRIRRAAGVPGARLHSGRADPFPIAPLVSREVLATGGVVLFGLVNIGLAAATRFSVVCALMLAGGIGWMTVNSTLNTAAQTSLPGWVRARALAVYLLVFQGAMAIGSVIWGEVASRYGLRFTLFLAGLALIAAAAVTARLRLGAADLDTTPSQHWPEPKIIVEPDPEHGPILITVEYSIDPERGADFARVMKEHGAYPAARRRHPMGFVRGRGHAGTVIWRRSWWRAGASICGNMRGSPSPTVLSKSGPKRFTGWRSRQRSRTGWPLAINSLLTVSSVERPSPNYDRAWTPRKLLAGLSVWSETAPSESRVSSHRYAVARLGDWGEHGHLSAIGRGTSAAAARAASGTTGRVADRGERALLFRQFLRPLSESCLCAVGADSQPSASLLGDLCVG